MAPRTGERWSSEGREIPFAEPGLKGPLFQYGGTSVRGGVEHDGTYAVIDFETTGLSPRRDRVVEVAIARVDARGRIEDEFATLINPEGRDVGPTFIHGITNAQVKRAPTFAEVAPELLARMSGAVVVAHNATFEEAFLAAELKRAGVDFHPIPALCTLWLGRQTFATPNYKLGTLARAGGVALVDKHAALGDVRAVSALLPQMTGKLRSPLLYSGSLLAWPPANLTGHNLPLVTRAVALRKGTDGWMHSLIARLPGSGLAPDDAAAESYIDALAEVLSDGRLSGEEAAALAHLAGSAGMGGAQVLGLNQRFLDGLKVVALEDEVLTPTEVRQLRAAAKALSLPNHFGDLQATVPHRLASLATSTGDGASEIRWRREGSEGSRLSPCSEQVQPVPKLGLPSALGPKRSSRCSGMPSSTRTRNQIQLDSLSRERRGARGPPGPHVTGSRLTALSPQARAPKPGATPRCSQTGCRGDWRVFAAERRTLEPRDSRQIRVLCPASADEIGSPSERG